MYILTEYLMKDYFTVKEEKIPPGELMLALLSGPNFY